MLISFLFILVLPHLLTTIYQLPISVSFAEESWSEAKGDHFIVYYRGEERFARDVLHQSEIYYKRIAADLGYQRYSEFWQWENRAKIYVYPTKEAFLKATLEPDWSHGVAIYSKKEIISYEWSDGFVEALLPHEIAHLIFRDFVGFKGEVPAWLDEGVAQYEEPAKRAKAKEIAHYLINSNKDFATIDLMRTDVRKIKDSSKVDNFYMQSVSLVDYMITTFGTGAFTAFCRELRDGKSFNPALRSAFNVENVTDLDFRWRDYVRGSRKEATAEVLYSK